MPGFGEFFGGSDQNTDIQTRSVLTPEQEELLKQLLSQFGADGGANFTPEGFGGDLSADLSGGEQLSLAALEQQALNRVAPNEAGNEALMELIQNRGSTGGFEDFFQTNVQAPALEGFENEVLPGIIRDFGGAQFASSERGEADTSARGDLLEGLTRSRSELAFKDRQSSADRLLQALEIQTGRNAGQVDDLVRTLDAQGIDREVEQQGLDRDFVEFARVQEEKNLRINQMLQILGIPAIENIGAVDPGSTGLLSLFGGGAALAGGEELGNFLSRLLSGRNADNTSSTRSVRTTGLEGFDTPLPGIGDGL